MEILKIIRPSHWMKNVFVFLPMFFGGSLFDGEAIKASLLAFVAFSLVASAVYCLNDIIDVEADRQHPVKRLRPIASGKVSIGQACMMMVVLVVFALAVAAFANVGLVAIIIGYLIMEIAYCLKLKQYAIVDVCILALGFVLRLLAGGFATGIWVSHWLVMMTFLLTLFLALAKRRDDVLMMNATGKAPRKNTERYNLTFINQAITINVAVAIVCYIMYTVSPEVVERFQTHYLYLTSIFCILGLLRYMQIAFVDEKSGDPTKVMARDHFLQLIVVAWAAAFAVIIYM